MAAKQGILRLSISVKGLPDGWADSRTREKQIGALNDFDPQVALVKTVTL